MMPDQAREGGGPTEEDRIGPEYYDRTDYIGDAPSRLRSLKSRFQRYRTRKVLDIYEPGKEERVLDLGCGWGTFSLLLAPRVGDVVGVDFSEKAVSSCRRSARELGLENVRFVQADAADTGLESESFDLVIAADLLEHLYPNQTESVLDECTRLLKRGGRLTVWTPHRGHLIEVIKNRTFLVPSDPTHVDYKSMDRVRGLLRERGFSIVKAYYAESHLPLLQDMERSLMAFVPFLRRRIAVLARKR